MPSDKVWNEYFMKVAFQTATLSKDPSTKVGCVIVSPDNRKISIGYNGFAKGLLETPSMWNDRELKLELVVHAEINSIFQAPFDTVGCKLYCTHQPCHKCTIMIVQAGISKVYWSEPYVKLGFENIIQEHVRLLETYEQIKI